jgi:enoyl-CoA hydratase/carnithine racemase
LTAIPAHHHYEWVSDADDTVQVEDRGETRWIRLNAPRRRNAYDQAMADRISDALESANGVRTVVITGVDRSFCAGGSLSTMSTPTTAQMRVLYRASLRLFDAIRLCPRPVIAAVNGAAAGIGCSFALACDLVLAAESSYFLLAFVNIGLVPDGGSSLLIPERVGFARAAELAMLGERLPARQALEWGLINRVVSDETLMSEAEVLADRLANGPTRSYAGTKRQLNAWQFARM